MKILLATNNQGKIDRFKRLVSLIDPQIVLCTPAELGLKSVEVEETAATLLGNAELKARAYEGRVAYPILANDTGFWVDGEGLVEAPKRQALGSVSERELSREELSKLVLEFWKQIASKHGGEVEAAWVEEFVLLSPEGELRSVSSRREVILTDKEYAEPPVQMPVRALYISKATNKPALLHKKEEEVLEMRPIVEALSKLLLS